MTVLQTPVETMQKRQSVRTYDIQPINKEDWDKLQAYLANDQNLVGPFGHAGKIETVAVTNDVTDQGIKIGTYGFIKNPKGYLVGVGQNNKDAIVEFGYIFHKIVLYATEMGLGTCWMGGTFDRHSFEKEIEMALGDFIPCVTPIGYPKDRQRLFDKALRYVVKADNKKPWEQLMYDGDFSKKLKKVDAERFVTPIEMVRIGPSASNKQPWRLVLSADREYVHFYIEHTPNYSIKLGYDMQLLDMGIAMCQFELACQEVEVSGAWVKNDPGLELPNQNYEYIVSWKVEFF